IRRNAPERINDGYFNGLLGFTNRLISTYSIPRHRPWILPGTISHKDRSHCSTRTPFQSPLSCQCPEPTQAIVEIGKYSYKKTNLPVQDVGEYDR
ncbi:hypothetical protein PQR05_33310, partial [Paraburkholderia sediminicola]|uniref:hypothetical protein n=1 Tax=Paraburkholderia sediminicola TaxID=458836 RepID=UPI0038BCF27B